MRIAEIFHSIQGEGQFAGTPSVFVRTTGCNLRCWFCDTDYTSWRPEGDIQSCQEILEQVRMFDCEHVVVTGGEPLLQPQVVALTHALAECGHFITIETAGTVFRPVHAELVSLSPKLTNSTPETGRWSNRHESLRDYPKVVDRLMADYAYQLKFVIDRLEDIAEVEQYLQRFTSVPAENVWLMPQATTNEEVRSKSTWIAAQAERRGYRLSPRLHIEMYGNVRGV